MTEFARTQVRFTCGLCGKPINASDQVASFYVTRKGGGERSVEAHGLCLKPHLHGAPDFVDDAATVDERQAIWDKSARR